MGIDNATLNQTFRLISLDADTQDKLVRNAQSGDSDAFARLYDHYVDEIYRYVYFLVLEQKTAEDLTARVFFKAWKNLDRFESGEESFGTWLYFLASSAVDSEHKAHPEIASVEELIPIATDEPVEHNIELQDDAEALRKALHKLNKEQQEVMILKFLSGMTTDEIASHLGQSAGSVRVMQRKALQALARHYGYR